MADLDKILFWPRRRGFAFERSTDFDVDKVRTAYRRWASVYDACFSRISSIGRRHATNAVNAVHGARVLEVGVGTGLALPGYSPQKHIVGIDLSVEMLAVARARVAAEDLRNVQELIEMDAEATEFADASFDIAVAMFVASVAPHPRRLLAEMRRVVRPGGHLIFVNHFAAESGPWSWVQRIMAPGTRELGWRSDFTLSALFASDDNVVVEPIPPFGFFSLAQMVN